MKTIVPVRKRNGLILPTLAVVSMLLAVFNCPANDGRIASSYSPSFNDTILVQKQLTSKKNKIKRNEITNHKFQIPIRDITIWNLEF